MDCRVYRCHKQVELYLYVREGLDPQSLPEPLLKRTGALSEVMQLRLDRPLARVDVAQVRAALAGTGYFLQLPPDGHIDPHLHFGD